MNGYIINPMWFYWVNIANTAKTAFGILAGILFLLGLCSVWALIDSDLFDDEETEKYWKATRWVIAGGLVCLIAAIFIPTKNTLIEMQIAKYATWENAEWTVGAIKDAVDYIVDAIGSIK